ncbi:hypothetical protein COCCADRAFT_94059, partial [Bipolaris zeicola 26-R-13]
PSGRLAVSVGPRSQQRTRTSTKTSRASTSTKTPDGIGPGGVQSTNEALLALGLRAHIVVPFVD